MFLLPYRHVLNRSRALIARPLRAFHASPPVLSLPIPPALSKLVDKTDVADARGWLDAFRNVNIPRNLVELSFARSSGPGGQVRVTHSQWVVIPHALTFEIRCSTEREQSEHESDSAMSNRREMDSSVGSTGVAQIGKWFGTLSPCLLLDL